jgi:hypothetical protein
MDVHNSGPSVGPLSQLGTGCNRIRYTTLKICDQKNSNITTQFLTEHLALQDCLQVFNMATTGYAADIQTIF